MFKCGWSRVSRCGRGRRKKTRREANPETKLGPRKRKWSGRKDYDKNMAVTGGLDKGHFSGARKPGTSTVGREFILEIWVGGGKERWGYSWGI